MNRGADGPAGFLALPGPTGITVDQWQAMYCGEGDLGAAAFAGPWYGFAGGYRPCLLAGTPWDGDKPAPVTTAEPWQRD